MQFSCGNTNLLYGFFYAMLHILFAAAQRTSIAVQTYTQINKVQWCRVRKAVCKCYQVLFFQKYSLPHKVSQSCSTLREVRSETAPDRKNITVSNHQILMDLNPFQFCFAKFFQQLALVSPFRVELEHYIFNIKEITFLDSLNAVSQLQWHAAT